jgi:hypothetical protein
VTEDRSHTSSASTSDDHDDSTADHDREMLLPSLGMERRDFMKAGAVGIARRPRAPDCGNPSVIPNKRT